MTPEQIKHVKDSWNSADDGKLAERFYEKLFELDPDLEDMFLNNMTTQQEKFRHTLATIVAHLDDPVTLLPKVQTLGLQHAGYGVRSEHYDTVQSALMEALRETLGASFNNATEQAWIAAYQNLAEVMKSADMDSIGYLA